jgi:hypothetical protein
MTVLLIIHWKCFSTSFATEPSLQIHFCNVNKFPIYFSNRFSHLFGEFIGLSVYFFKKYVIKSFTCLNTISNFIKLFHVGPGHRQKPCTILKVETELCAFCGETRETILHLFCDCSIVKNTWLKLYERLQIKCGGLSGLFGRDILLGIPSLSTKSTQFSFN